MKIKCYILAIFMLGLISCEPIVENETYGSYIVDDIVIKNGVSTASYTFHAENGNDGFVKLYRNNQYVETVYYDWRTTVSPTQTYTFDFSIAKITVKKAGTGTINLYNMPYSIFNKEYYLYPEEIKQNSTHGSYIVDSISFKGGKAGRYTFYTVNGNDGFVKLYRDGILVEQLNYNWQTTVTSSQAYTFNFTNVRISVRKAGTGSMNLYNMPQSIFDGYHSLTVNEKEIAVGNTYGPYIVTSISIANIAPGKYTFYAKNGSDGFVNLYRNGSYVETINYDWRTTVTSKLTYTFHFKGLSISVKKAGTGSINLYNMPQSIFNRVHKVTVD